MGSGGATPASTPASVCLPCLTAGKITKIPRYRQGYRGETHEYMLDSILLKALDKSLVGNQPHTSEISVAGFQDDIR